MALAPVLGLVSVLVPVPVPVLVPVLVPAMGWEHRLIPRIQVLAGGLCGGREEHVSASGRTLM